MVMMMECWPCTLKPWQRLTVLTVTVCLYLVFGALVFTSLESKEEERQIAELRLLKNQFVAKMSKCNVSNDDLEHFLSKVVTASQSGILVTNNVTFSSNWSFGKSVFFVVTLITTIGYGHTLSLSAGGKAFAIFYSLVGMPLIITLFSSVVVHAMSPINALLRLLKRKAGHLVRETCIEILHLFIILVPILALFFAVPAVIFMVLENDWDYLDALYYCYISLTTIGLGDYVPGELHGEPGTTLYQIAVAFYLMLGLICMMTLLTIIYNIKCLNLTNYFTREDDSKEEDPEEQYLTTPSDSPIRYTDDQTDEEEKVY